MDPIEEVRQRLAKLNREADERDKARVYPFAPEADLPYAPPPSVKMGFFSNVRDAIALRVAKGMLKDAAKGRYGEGVKQMLNFLDGKKTWLGVVLIALGYGAQAASHILPAQAIILAPAGEWLIGAGVAMSGIGAAHKLAKGE